MRLDAGTVAEVPAVD